jgi:hypothetical protein
MDNIETGKDYARIVINTIIEGELDIPEEERMDTAHIHFLTKEIEKMADDTWMDYITGDRESFMFTEEEMYLIWERSGLAYTDHLLNELVDKGMVEVGIGVSGDLLYKATEEAKRVIESIDNPSKNKRKRKK